MQSPTTVLFLICVDALNATTGNSSCKHCIHLSTISFGTRSTTHRIKHNVQSTHFSFNTLQTKNLLICVCVPNCKLTCRHLMSIYLFCLEPKAASCCLPSAAQPPPAVDTCTPVDHEHRGLLSLHQMHQLPVRVEREVMLRIIRLTVLFYSKTQTGVG